jgi:hypothetical protein
MIPGTGAHISPCLVKYCRGSRGPEKAWDVSRIATQEKDDVTISSRTDVYPFRLQRESYGYIGHLGALACSFCHQEVSTCIPRYM